MLEKKIRLHVTAAVQRKDNTERDILRLALSEIERESSKKDLTEEQKENIIRKLIKSNVSTLEFMDDSNDGRDILLREIDALKVLLPKEMTKEDVLAFINGYNVELIDNNVGRSVGMVMKAMKENNIVADGKLVKQVITEMFDG